MGVLYLRFLIGGLNVLFVVAVACMTLALALTISFKSLRDNADTAVSRLGSATAKQVDNFFAAPQRRLADLATANLRFAGLGTFPSESPSFRAATSIGSSVSAGGEILQGYRQLMTAMMVESEFRYITANLMFYDGSYVWQVIGTQLGQRVLSTVVTWPTGPFPTQQHPLVATGHTIPGAVEHPLITAFVASVFANYSFVTDGRIPLVPITIMAGYNAGSRSNGSPVSWGDVFFTALTHIEYFVLTLGCPMVNGTGTNLGHASLVLRTDEVSEILTEGQLTPATRLVVYDVDGFLFGASSSVQVYTSEPFVGPTTKPGCTTTNQSAIHFPSDLQKRACRYHLRDAPISTVRDASNADLSFFMQPSLKGAVKLIESQYVYVQRLSTLEGARAFTIAMVVPEEDMIGDAKKILPICAGVTAAVVVFVAAISLIVVWAVLRPLQAIAMQMAKAARLEDDAEPVAVSSLVEIGDLQRAFIEMRDELSRIRAFVPQSLLRANDDDADELNDDDLSIDGDMSGAEFTPSRSNQHSGLYVSSSCATPTQRSIMVESSAVSSPVKQQISPGPGSPYRLRRRGSASTGYTSQSGQKEKPAPKAARGLQLTAGVRFENVSVLSLNMRGYHAAVKDGLSVDKVAATVSTVLRIAQQEKGVVDSFHGDRFMISFNAVKPAANHAIRAAMVAARIAKALCPMESNQAPPASTFDLPLTAGIATGPAQVGNLGSSEMKRFSIVGPVVSQAACLERLCKLYSEAVCLVPHRLFGDLRTAVLVKTCDYVQLPFVPQAVLIGAVLREHTHAADDEWMYQLQQATEDNAADGKAPNFSPTSVAHAHLNNTVWEMLLGGRTAEAVAAYAELEEKAQGQVLPTLRSNATKAKASPNENMTPHDFGEFYTDGVLHGAPVMKF